MVPADAEGEVEVIQQACAIPFRRRAGALEFCLITSLSKGRWIFPKGIVDPGETLEETAAKESLEEAGLHGSVVGAPLGRYEDAKWGARLEVTGVLLAVARCDEHWLEADQRQRRWAPAREALSLLARPEMRRLATAAIDRLATDGEA